MLVGTALAITYMFNTFVTSSEFQDYVVEDYYDSYYDMEDRLDEAIEEGDEQDVREYTRALERLKGKICEIDTAWDRCKPVITD